MKAIITNKDIHNGKNLSGDKELVSAYSVIGNVKGEMREIVTARCYMDRSRSASTVYATVWVHGDGFNISGHGSAGGWGYHKESSAIGEAISSAGIELYGNVYDSTFRWNREESRENTPKEIAALKRKANKTRAYINGAGEQAVKDALEAIAKAAGAKSKILIVSH